VDLKASAGTKRK